jgi:hypothetical protein
MTPSSASTSLCRATTHHVVTVVIADDKVIVHVSNIRSTRWVDDKLIVNIHNTNLNLPCVVVLPTTTIVVTIIIERRWQYALYINKLLLLLLMQFLLELLIDIIGDFLGCSVAHTLSVLLRFEW